MLYVVTILIENSALGAMGCLNSGRKTVETSTITSVNSDASQCHGDEEAGAQFL